MTDPSVPAKAEQVALIEAMVDDIAEALARVRMGSALEAARLKSETETLRDLWQAVGTHIEASTSATTVDRSLEKTDPKNRGG